MSYTYRTKEDAKKFVLKSVIIIALWRLYKKTSIDLAITVAQQWIISNEKMTEVVISLPHLIAQLGFSIQGQAPLTCKRV